MPNAELMAEAYKRGLLPKERATIYEEAVKRGLLKTTPQIHAMIDANTRNRIPGTADARQIVNGMTLGASRFLNAADEAKNTAIQNVASKLSNGAIEGKRYTPVDAFNAEVNSQIQQDKQFEHSHPRKAIVENIGGSLFTPGLGEAASFIKGAKVAKDASLGVKAAALGGRIKRAAIVGSGIGATQGALGSEKLSDVPKNALNSAEVGAIAGGISTPLVEGGAKIVNSLMSHVGGIGNTARATVNALFDPKHASEEVSRLAESRAKAHIVERAKAGLDLTKKTAAEALGPTGIAELSSITRRPGETAQLAQNMIEDRQLARDQEFHHVLHRLTGIDPEVAKAGIDEVVQAGQKRVAPLFDNIRQLPGHVWNEELSQLSKRPAIAKAIRTAHEGMLNRGENPGALTFLQEHSTQPRTVQPGRKIASPPQTVTSTKAQNLPTAEVWGRVKAALQSNVERHPITGRVLPNSVSQNNADTSAALDALNHQLKATIPGYATAMAQSGEYKSVEGAFNRVAKNGVFKSSTTPEDFSRMWSSLKTSGERAAARHAVMSQIFDAGEQKSGVIGKFVTASGKPIPAVQKKLQIAFGKEAADKIISHAKTVKAEMLAESRIAPNVNSTTGSAVMHAKVHDAIGSHGIQIAQGIGGASAGALAGYELDGRHSLKSAAEGALLGAAATRGLHAKGLMEEEFRNALGRHLLDSPENINALAETAAKTPFKRINPAFGIAVPAASNSAKASQRMRDRVD